ncbi:hypothetical protein LOK49_LG01G00297 [Camellia lanceoleosa]|uniref:Uncharacterized protein n=1 Tax=Camellia lanceoleosa TaxID=1840588 RepID=A0ACC0J3E9_9ERIC|nr:hypothetical protein LOK49_LG01G00297 [Camellia lanceoleosa]
MALGYSFHRSTIFELFAVEFDISESIHSFFHIPNRNHVGLEIETSRFVLFFEFSYLPPLIEIFFAESIRLILQRHFGKP